MTYRKEIDGLRALAVISVVLFHAGFQHFQGGFIGVDIFFVISGYLITSLIKIDITAGTFSIFKFYERRARRILPALFLVTLVTIPFAWFWLMPEELKEYLLSLCSIILISSNIYFWWISDYFNSATEIKPLLHTWSLAVEEQFYLLFPFLMVGLSRFSKKTMATALFFLCVISFMAAQAGGNFNFSSPYLNTSWSWWNSPRWAFYFSISRAWELLLGSLIATINPKAISFPKFLDELLGGIGLISILYAIFTFNKFTPHPSLYTIIPTVGTCLLILFAKKNTFIGRCLSHSLFVKIGLISYGIYLWHHPVFAFARIKLFNLDSNLVRVALIVVVFSLASLTYVLIERPIRHKKYLSNLNLVLCSGFFSVVFFSAGFAGQIYDGFKFRLNQDQLNILRYTYDEWIETVKKDPCSLGPQQTSKDFLPACDGGNKGAPAKELLIWGDSFASALAQGFKKNLQSKHFLSQYTASGCLPFFDFELPDRKNCGEINKYVMAQIKKNKPSEIILHANWERLLSENTLTLAQIETALRDTLKTLKLISPRSHVHVVGNLPLWRPSLPYYLVSLSIVSHPFQKMKIKNPGISLQNEFESRLRLTVKSEGAHFISLIEKLCTKNDCTAVIQRKNEKIPIVFDYGHLTPEGSNYLARTILPSLRFLD